MMVSVIVVTDKKGYVMNQYFQNAMKDNESESFLAKFLGRVAHHKKQKSGDIDLGLNRIYLALNRAYKSRNFLEVSVPGDSTIYQSILLEVDPEEKTLLIDEFFPNTLVGLPGQKMRFSLRQAAGRSIVFQTSIIERHTFDGSPVYVISMPEALDEHQRRVAFRMNVPNNLTIDSSFLAPDKQAYAARVCDVSSDGVCIETQGDITKALRAGDSLKNASFEFAGVDIVCDLTVRNLVDRKDEQNDKEEGASKITKTKVKRIGAQFNNLPIQTRRRLEKSIMQLQREQLQRASNSNELLLN